MSASVSASPAPASASSGRLVCWNKTCHTDNPSYFLGCSRCATALYCGKDCQQVDWKIHRVSCVQTIASIAESFNRLMTSAMSDEDFAPLREFIDSLNAIPVAEDMRSEMIFSMISAGLIGTTLQVISTLNPEMQLKEMKKVLNHLVRIRAFEVLDQIKNGHYQEHMTEAMTFKCTEFEHQISAAKREVGDASISIDQMLEIINKGRKQIGALGRFESFKGKMDATVQELFTRVNTLSDLYEKAHDMRSSASSSFIRNAYIFQLLQITFKD